MKKKHFKIHLRANNEYLVLVKVVIKEYEGKDHLVHTTRGGSTHMLPML